jgi:ABC-type hemin transport system ATPase subunit
LWISRIRVTGGFLTGLDLHLSPRLNVIIGTRGVGKSSILEIIRFGLGLEYTLQTRQSQYFERIKGILGAGEIILDLESDDVASQLIVDASGRGRRQEFTRSALMVGQNELESIASDPDGRLKLLDLRADVPDAPKPAPNIASLTEHLFRLRESIASLGDELRTRSILMKDRETIAMQEAALMKQASRDLESTRDELGRLEYSIQVIRRDQAIASQLRQSLLASGDAVAAAARTLADNSAENMSEQLRENLDPPLQLARRSLSVTDSHIRQLEGLVVESAQQLADYELDLRARATPLRTLLDQSEKGLGEVTARLRNIDLQLSTLDLASVRLRTLQQQHAEAQQQRSELLDEFEIAQELRYQARTEVAREVSQRLEHKVVISIEHLSDSQDYRDTLLKLLQGSGFQFRGPADAISRATLPRQFATLIENGDTGQLAEMTGLPELRIARAIAHLDEPRALSEIVSVNLEDAATFLLRVGSELKSVDELSTGQKCAVTLPILLTEHSKPLILDQPEDHLDNAFLVDTVVRSIRQRIAAGAQTIIATHNANIPVLGGADTVVSMSSDGRRGYAHNVGTINERTIIRDITNVMEGGIDAFRARADFYETYGDDASRGLW